jgi:thioredoxin reductase (NADPH)
MMTDAQQTGEISDLLIIGGGPTGLFAAFYAGLRKMSVTIVDSLEVLGGQLVTLYPEKDIYDVAGFPKVLAKDLASNLVEQALQYHPRICLGEQVMTLEFDEGESCYNVTTTSSKHRSRAILIAAGIGSFTPKTLSLPGASDYLGRGLHYFVTSIEPFKGRRVLIVGGGDSAVDWANMLSPLADKVTLIHRRDQFRAHEDSVIKMRAGRTQIQTFCELKSIGGKSCVDCATIYDNRSKAEQLIEVDHVLVNIGFESTLGPIAGWGLNLEGGQIVVDAMMQTNRPGIFAAGDAATFPGKLKLIATGFGEACTAVNFAKHYLDPAANIFPGHSSNMKR